MRRLHQGLVIIVLATAALMVVHSGAMSQPAPPPAPSKPAPMQPAAGAAPSKPPGTAVAPANAGGKQQAVPGGAPVIPSGAAGAPATAQVNGAPPANGAAPAVGGEAQPAPPQPPTDVAVTVRTWPPKVKAKVYWGRSMVGTTPLVLKRPRDSGPLDLILKAEGYIPAHTRAYTFGNDTVIVKLTSVEQKSTLFGYKQELPPEDGSGSGAVTPAQ